MPKSYNGIIYNGNDDSIEEDRVMADNTAITRFLLLHIRDLNYLKKRNTPITLPTISTSDTMIGSIKSFSGCNR